VSPKGGRRKLLLFGGATVLVLAAMVGLVFGWYLPNTPQNVYNTGLNRTGKAVSSVVDSVTDKQTLQAYQTSVISGSIKADVDGGSYGGDFTTSFDKADLTGGLNVTLKDSGSSKTLSAKVMSHIPDGSVYPDLYFQLSGLKALGIDEFMPGASAYDGKWISVSSKYLQSIGDTYLKTSDNTKQQLTTDDIAEVARTAANTTQQYLFTTAPDKAVFEQRSYVGKEKVDGISSYHYKVSLNVQHAKDYCVALGTAMLNTSAYKKLASDNSAQTAEKQSLKSDCDRSVGDAVKPSDTYDMWIDGHYKLIHKIRVYDKTDHASYTDVGQTYKGGNKLSLFVNVHDAKQQGDGAFTLDTDVSTRQTDATLSYKSTSADNPENVTVQLHAKLSADAVKVTPPAGAVPIQDVLKQFGIDPTSSAGAASDTPVGLKAADTERETDIRSLQANLEAYYAENGAYPTLDLLNDASWQQTNLKGLDPSALVPPDSAAKTLAAAATKTQYGYAAADCKAQDCQAYTLTALLSNGSTFSVKSLN
ncbi:MAG TPA: hypothetical protein VFH39_01760, partial [Candidatus Saccharimonadales bacterium]|nr:hypothetical protein [Candidatus Saccharimonadales bacterium]